MDLYNFGFRKLQKLSLPHSKSRVTAVAFSEGTLVLAAAQQVCVGRGRVAG